METFDIDGLSPDQQKRLIDMLWDYLKADPDNKKTRVQTGIGTKTQEGLLRSILRIVREK